MERHVTRPPPFVMEQEGMSPGTMAAILPSGGGVHHHRHHHHYPHPHPHRRSHPHPHPIHWLSGLSIHALTLEKCPDIKETNPGNSGSFFILVCCLSLLSFQLTVQLLLIFLAIK